MKGKLGRNRDAPVWALGAMSGTSLDGVDAAALQTDGRRIMAFGESRYRPYTDEERASLNKALGRWPGDDLGTAPDVLMAAHVEVLSDLLGERPGATVIGFHGQTLAHDPAGRGTHQMGDGDALATALGRDVVWDFRSADVGLGGQGAPLAPFFHFACAKWIGATAPIAFLNLGGVGNLTWVDPRFAAPEDDGALLAFDTGPANAPLNDLMTSRRGTALDADGVLAAQGTVAEGVLERFLEHGYFLKIPPKSLDRNDFPALAGMVSGLGDADAAATLTALPAASVMRGMEHCPSPPARVLVTGGGRHNAVMMAMLAAALDCPVDPVEAVGLDGDMLEAQAFAFLAVRVLRGLPTSAPATTGVAVPVGGGRIARVEPGQSRTGR